MKIKTLFFKYIKVALLIASTGSPGLVFASHNAEKFVRLDPYAPSNSGHDVNIFCGGRWDGTDYPNQKPAKAKLSKWQFRGKTIVNISLKHGRPDTLYTVWLRLKGNDMGGNSYGGSPLTGGGATPLAAGEKLDQLSTDWLGAGSLNPANGFTTNSQGRGRLRLSLDFPLEGGAYPFNKISAEMLENIRIGKNPSALAKPTAIVDPRDDGVSGPFLLRIVSHCQDGLGHGLSPSNRESWFDFPE